MKVAVALVLAGVVAVSAMPQSDSTAEPDPMTPVTDEQVKKMVEMKKGMEHLMGLYKLCMMKEIIKNCGCTGATGCEVLDAIMKCHHFDIRGRGLSKMMPDNMLMQEPHSLTDEKLNKVSEAQCEMILPAPKHLINTVMKDDEHWHLSYVCMSVQNYEDQYRNCVVPAAHKYLRMEKKN